MPTWIEKELREIERVRQGNNDQYNTIGEKHVTDIISEPHLNHKFAPVDGQTFESYIEQLKIYIKYADDKNIATHINGPRRAWYTHKSSPNCFMCEDVDLRHVMLSAMLSMANAHPKDIF